MPQRPHFRRDLSDQVARRAAHLPPADRALLLAAMDRGVPTAELAAITGMPIRSLRRQVRNLTRRVLSPDFAFVIQSRRHWPILRRRIATAVIIHGKSARAAAADAGTTLHIARKHLEAIQLLIDARTESGK